MFKNHGTSAHKRKIEMTIELLFGFATQNSKVKTGFQQKQYKYMYN
jgi:hypothetical protein